jgi:hypothetical protein
MNSVSSKFSNKKKIVVYHEPLYSVLPGKDAGKRKKIVG